MIHIATATSERHSNVDSLVTGGGAANGSRTSLPPGSTSLAASGGSGTPEDAAAGSDVLIAPTWLRAPRLPLWRPWGVTSTGGPDDPPQAGVRPIRGKRRHESAGGEAGVDAGEVALRLEHDAERADLGEHAGHRRAGQQVGVEIERPARVGVPGERVVERRRRPQRARCPG